MARHKIAASEVFPQRGTPYKLSRQEGLTASVNSHLEAAESTTVSLRIRVLQHLSRWWESVSRSTRLVQNGGVHAQCESPWWNQCRLN